MLIKSGSKGANQERIANSMAQFLRRNFQFRCNIPRIHRINTVADSTANNWLLRRFKARCALL